MTQRLAILRLALLAAVAAPTAALAVGPDYHRPDVPLTPAYQGEAALPRSPAPAAPQEAWWRGFGDPGLTRAVERALAQNLDLAQARARVLQSRAVARAAGAALLPQGRATAQAAHVQQSLQSPIGEIARGLPGFERSYGELAVGSEASWEIDLFGGRRREREAARADAQAAAREAEAIRLSIAAEAADAYLQARAFQGRLAVARRQEQVEQDLVDLLGQRAAQGVSPDRELREARAELAGVQAAIPPLAAGREAELNRLDVLMGAQAGTYHAELAEAAPEPAAPSLASADRPADLLRRRPDVLAAEQRLVAANARIGAAVADYYPKISLSGLLGVESLAPGPLFAERALTHQVGAGLSWRLFDFGRVDAEVAQARGRQAEALAAYRQTVYRATEEVEDAFTDLVQQEARAAALQQQIEQLTVARGQAQQAYEGGVASLVEVRDADRELLAASDQLVQARAGAARAAVAAFRALGGGWSAPAATSPHA
jgi:NodT family efflux transporter outer membrane factor (OMF) lipoprotein